MFNEKWQGGSEVSDADGVVSSVTDFHILNLQGVGQTIFRQGYFQTFHLFSLPFPLPAR